MSKPTRSAPHAIDVAVGGQIRARRRAMKISQEALAEAIKVTFQQVQKYERGANRVSASMLYEICRTLQCQPSDLMPAPDWYLRDMTPKWLNDARSLHALHPRLFEVLMHLPEESVRLLVISLQAMAGRVEAPEHKVIA